MKRRILIFVAAFAIYAAFISVAWVIGTRQAEKNTEWQLDYAVIDFHDTVAGAIDTMLGHVARTAVRHMGSAKPLPMERMAAGAKELDIDEVNVVTREGRIIASNDPHCMGVEMAGDPVMNEFMALTNGITATVSQPFRPHARNPEFRAKYLAAAFPGGDGFVQVGLDERRLARMLPSILGYIFDEWLLGKTGCFLCADLETGRLISNPSRHRDEAKTLSDTGFDIVAAKPYEIVADGRNLGRTFRHRIFGEVCFCRNFIFGGHRFVAVLPQREFYDTRTVFVSVFAVLLFVVLAAFAVFVDRIFRDAARLKAFYADDEARREKDMTIAKTIQASALPVAIPPSPSFRVTAAMQPARDVGGDFYDYFRLDASHVAFLVADVSGKGITAALYMMTAKTLIKDTLIATHDPALTLSKVNAELCANNPANMFLTVWVGVLDLETGIVSFANAGHNPPLKIASLKAKGQETEAEANEKSIDFVTAKSGPVLAFLDGVKYASRALRLNPGDAFFLYTDGVTEALDAQNELFGEERLTNAIKAIPNPEPHALCTVVRAAVAAFAAGMAQTDDITVLAIRYIAPPHGFSRSFPPTQEGIASASDYLDEIIAAEDARIKSDAANAASRETPSGVFRLASLSASLHIVLDEICSNIVKHSGASGFEVDIGIEESARSVKMTFTDDGVAYDPLSHADPDTTLPAEARPIGGLGIMMVKKLASGLSYRRTRNRNFFTVELSEKR